jgi:hypothetical protein
MVLVRDKIYNITLGSDFIAISPTNYIQKNFPNKEVVNFHMCQWEKITKQMLTTSNPTILKMSTWVHQCRKSDNIIKSEWIKTFKNAGFYDECGGQRDCSFLLVNIIL